MAKNKSIRKKKKKQVETLTHDEASRPNTPTDAFNRMIESVSATQEEAKI